MRLLALAACLLTSTALAQEGGSYRVVGGAEASEGAWPDVAGIVFNDQFVGCTGTLIAPNVVVTAEHCVTGGSVSHVILDETNWWQSESVIIEVDQAIRHPVGDIAVLILAEDALDITPRPVADGCIIDEYLEDGAPVSIVGYGLTTPNEQFNTTLMEGMTEVVDFECGDTFRGCNTRLDVGSELYAGGDGVDACSGDSGGPLFLLTPLGDYLVGVTSRGPRGCRNGAVWVRPDAFVDWIEDETGVDIPLATCNEFPEIASEFMTVPAGKSRRTDLVATDPEGDDTFTWDIFQAPLHGDVTIDENGRATFTAHEDYAGEDEFWVTVTDTTGFPLQSAHALVQVNIVEKSFLGCSSSGAPAGALWLVGLGGLFLRRRR